MKLPCIDCIVLAMCKPRFNVPEIGTLGPSITNFVFKCSLLKDYIKLIDLGIPEPADDASVEERAPFVIPLAQRIVTLFDYMGWTEKTTNNDMHFYQELAKGNTKVLERSW